MRADYATHAVGCVQLQRKPNGTRCVVKAVVTPEHRVRADGYNVEAAIDEANQSIHVARCYLIAFLSVITMFWIFTFF